MIFSKRRGEDEETNEEGEKVGRVKEELQVRVQCWIETHWQGSSTDSSA